MLFRSGYGSLAITLDHHTLEPASPDLSARIESWRRAVAAAGMTCVIETGARHLLDVRVKHEPTLVTASSEARARRVAFTCGAIDVAADLGAGCVSLWSGVCRDAADAESIWGRLTHSLDTILDHAARRGVVLGFEPEPGMFIDTLARYGEIGRAHV